MVERHEVWAWVQPDAWDDDLAGERAVDAIVESGATDEVEWARIAYGDDYAASLRRTAQNRESQ